MIGNYKNGASTVYLLEPHDFPLDRCNIDEHCNKVIAFILIRSFLHLKAFSGHKESLSRSYCFDEMTSIMEAN